MVEKDIMEHLLEKAKLISLQELKVAKLKKLKKGRLLWQQHQHIAHIDN